MERINLRNPFGQFFQCLEKSGANLLFTPIRTLNSKKGGQQLASFRGSQAVMRSQHPIMSGQKNKKTTIKVSPRTQPNDLPQSEENFDQGATAGPSSPSRRRRRPSASRRRSSSITAATSLISSYSKSPPSKRDEEEDGNVVNLGKGADSPGKRPDMNRQGTSASDVGFAGGATETFQDARDALERGVASPYHMALVTLLGSLAQGMPLASMFKVYSYIMCRVYQQRQPEGPRLRLFFGLPPAPELPSDPICADPWVQKATATYAAAMATVGALLGLVLLDRCNRYSKRFGRKPLMLCTHILAAFAFVIFRISVFLPTYLAAVVLYSAVMLLEASAGAPLRIAIQNYVVDTTTETQRAGALSFIDGFGQLGAFPSATVGGLLAAMTQTFFAPFYASVSIYIFAVGYILVFVPESKKNRHHTLIDNWEHGLTGGNKNRNTHQQMNTSHEHETSNDGQVAAGSLQDQDGSSEDMTQRSLSYISTVPSEHSTQYQESRIKRLIHKFNFLEPLSVFLPKSIEESGTKKRDWRLLNLAMIVLFEESFQVFLVPILLLYNTEVFQYDVVQNGYLVSLLQGSRALFLTVIFPPAIAKARAWIGKRHSRKSSQHNGEHSPLLPNSDHQRHYGARPKLSSQQVEVRDMADEEAQTNQGHQDQKMARKDQRGKLDIGIMFISYLICTGSFILLCFSKSQKENIKIPAYIGIGIAIIGLQIGSGATSVRTALIVNAVGENEEQSKALAANQILCTGIYAVVPLITSFIFGLGLQMGKPEIVWTFKAIMAASAAISTLILFLSYPSPPSHRRH